MSEYQRYEFLALDRPLTAKQMAALRAISSRAEISATRFCNEYQWGDLKADPAKLLARYFDAHLYFANWGTRRLMLRVPKARVDAKALDRYFVARDGARLARVGEHIVLALTIDVEEATYDDEPGDDALAALSPLRSELMRGDLRPAYLAWLHVVDQGDVEDDAMEPPVPAGLAELTAAQEALVEFLGINLDLVTAAAEASASTSAEDPSFRRWLSALSAKEKDAWLTRAADEPDLALGGELRRAFRTTVKRASAAARRTAGELRSLAEAQRAKPRQARRARTGKAKTALRARRRFT